MNDVMQQKILEWLAPLTTNLEQLQEGIHLHFLNIIGAVLLLLLGWLLAKLFRFLISRLSKGIDFVIETLAHRYKLLITKPKHSIAHGIANVGFWLIVLFFISSALQVLGWSTLIIIFRHYVPLLFGAAIIIFIGYAVGNLLSRAITSQRESIGEDYAAKLSKLTQFFVLLFSILIALEHVGLDITLIEMIVIVVLASFFVGGAFAFGLGASSIVKNILAYRTVCKMYQIGQTVHSDSVQGKLVEIQPQFVVIETPDGKVVMPVYQFAEGVNTLVEGSRDPIS